MTNDTTSRAVCDNRISTNEMLKLAETIHKARWPEDRQFAVTPFADEGSVGREYCFRIARAVAAAPPTSGQREDIIKAILTIGYGFKIGSAAIEGSHANAVAQRSADAILALSGGGGGSVGT